MSAVAVETTTATTILDNCSGCKKYTQHEVMDYGHICTTICLSCDHYEEFEVADDVSYLDPLDEGRDRMDDYFEDWRLW